MADNVYISNTANLAKYMNLDQKGKVLAEYIWIDGSNGLRNKTKVSKPALQCKVDFTVRHCMGGLSLYCPTVSSHYCTPTTKWLHLRKNLSAKTLALTIFVCGIFAVSRMTAPQVSSIMLKVCDSPTDKARR